MKRIGFKMRLMTWRSLNALDDVASNTHQSLNLGHEGANGAGRRFLQDVLHDGVAAGVDGRGLRKGVAAGLTDFRLI
jgi:hypothetical protein